MALLALALLLAATPCAARRGVNYDMTIDETDPVRKSRLKAHVRRIRAAVNLGAELTINEADQILEAFELMPEDDVRSDALSTMLKSISNAQIRDARIGNFVVDP